MGCIENLYCSTVQEEHLNRGGGLHGGFTATLGKLMPFLKFRVNSNCLFLVDNITTYALCTHGSEDNVRPGVSVDLHVSYLKGAKCNDVVEIDATTIKCGMDLNKFYIGIFPNVNLNF